VVGRPIMQAHTHRQTHTQTDAHTDRHRQTHTERERHDRGGNDDRMNTVQHIICSRATSCLHGEDDEREVLIVCSKHGN
jgi:hypothetical protein